MGLPASHFPHHSIQSFAMDQVTQGKYQSGFTRCNRKKKKSHHQQFLFTASLQECLSFYLVSIKLVAVSAADAAYSSLFPGIPIRADMVPALLSSAPDLQAPLQTVQCPAAPLRASCVSHGGPQDEPPPALLCPMPLLRSHL